jgi:hypothetical protein
MPRPKKQGNPGTSSAGSDELGEESFVIGPGSSITSPIEDSGVPEPTPGTTQECYVTMIGAQGILEKLDKLMAMGKERSDDELYALGRTLKWEFGRMCTRATAQVKAKKKSEALTILASDWGWQHKNLGYDIIHLLRTRCDLTAKDLSILLGISESAVIQGVQRYSEKIGEQTKLYEDSEKHERAELLMERIYSYIMDPNFPAMDRDKLNAAKAYVELYNKQLERDTSLTWHQVSMVSDWFFSELLPTLQQRLQAENSSVSVRQICLELFDKLTGDIRELSTKVKLPPKPGKEEDAPKLTKSGRPYKKTGRKPKGGEKHI